MITIPKNGGIIMEEGKGNFSKELEQKVKEHQAVLLKYPKNIRQIGEIGDGQKIYVEDYVMTYTAYLGSKARDSYRSAILLGQKAVVEGRRTLFISGAVEIPQQWKQELSITGEQWTVIYDQMQQYFQDIEILGWFLTRPGMELEVEEQIQTVWRSCFDGTDKILFLYDNISREDAFYTCKEGKFQRQGGYYIYYEKNEEMQNYMIDEKGGKSTDEGYQDKTSEKIRKKIEEKNQINIKYLHHQQFAYSVGILASAVVLVTAATKLYHSTSEDTVSDFVTDAKTVFKDNSWILSKEGKEVEEKQQTAEQEKEKESLENAEQQENKQQENIEKKDKKEQENIAENKEETNESENKEQTTKSETPKIEEDVKQVSSGNVKKGKKKRKKKYYIVKKGDTLESISISCYGTSKYIKKIKKINKLENANKIYIGQKLTLP